MADAGIDADLMRDIELDERTLERLDLLKRYGRILLAEDAEHRPIDRLELVLVGHERRAVIQHRGIEGLGERQLQRLSAAKAPTQRGDLRRTVRPQIRLCRAHVLKAAFRIERAHKYPRFIRRSPDLAVVQVD